MTSAATVEAGQPLAAPLSSSPIRRSRRSSRVLVTRQEPRRDALASGARPDPWLTQSTAEPPRDHAQLHAADAAPQPDPAGEGRELDNRRMTDSARSPGCLSRRERGRAEQGYDERYGEHALTGEIHHASRDPIWLGC